MDNKDFVLNDVFEKNAKVYQTKPVLATKYKPGMENGWMAHFTNKALKAKGTSLHEGVKFFDTEQEALDYIKADNKQYAEENGVLVEIPVEYDPPMPVLYRKETNQDKKVGLVDYIEEKTALKSNETDQFDFFILSYYYQTPDTWIIQDADGGIRIWDEDYPECCSETFFGKDNDIVYEKVAEDKYVKVALY